MRIQKEWKKKEGREKKRMKKGIEEERKKNKRTGKDLFPQFERDCKAQIHFVLPSPQYVVTASVAPYTMTMNMFL